MKYLAIAIVIIANVFTISCSKSSGNADLGDGTVATVEFAVGGSEFEGGQNFGNRSATPNHTESEEYKINRETLDVGNDMLLIAEISPEYSQEVNNSIARSATSLDKKAAIENNVIPNGIRYRVLVFNSDGTFNRQQEYTTGSEAGAPAMNLDGGRSYTFVAYSINTAAATVAPTFATGQPQTLANCSVSVAGNQDFMYFIRRDFQLIGGPDPNRLNVVLKHLFSQVTTIIDASQTGYNPVSINASFGPHSSTASINLDSRVVTRNAQGDRSSVNTTFTGGTTTNSYPTIINASANNTTDYVIASLRVGDLTITNLRPFSTLNITPGVKYNLTLRLVPTDEYLTYSGTPSIRINGSIWAMHNVGADTTVSINQSPITATLHGDYHQFGRRTRSAAPTANSQNAWINNRNVSRSAWNSGTEIAPEKVIANDPCPTDFRVPTRTEWQNLVDDTTPSTTGSATNSSSNLNGGIFLMSKRKFGVRMLLPRQGFFNVSGSTDTNIQPTSINNRGSNGYYVTSSGSGSNLWAVSFGTGTVSVSQLTNNNSFYSQTRVVRCIAD